MALNIKTPQPRTGKLFDNSSVAELMKSLQTLMLHSASRVDANKLETFIKTNKQTIEDALKVASAAGKTADPHIVELNKQLGVLSDAIDAMKSHGPLSGADIYEAQKKLKHDDLANMMYIMKTAQKDNGIHNAKLIDLQTKLANLAGQTAKNTYDFGSKFDSYSASMAVAINEGVKLADANFRKEMQKFQLKVGKIEDIDKAWKDLTKTAFAAGFEKTIGKIPILGSLVTGKGVEKLKTGIEKKALDVGAWGAEKLGIITPEQKESFNETIDELYGEKMKAVDQKSGLASNKLKIILSEAEQINEIAKAQTELMNELMDKFRSLGDIGEGLQGALSGKLIDVRQQVDAGNVLSTSDVSPIFAEMDRIREAQEQAAATGTQTSDHLGGALKFQTEMSSDPKFIKAVAAVHDSTKGKRKTKDEVTGSIEPLIDGLGLKALHKEIFDEFRKLITKPADRRAKIEELKSSDDPDAVKNFLQGLVGSRSGLEYLESDNEGNTPLQMLDSLLKTPGAFANDQTLVKFLMGGILQSLGTGGIVGGGKLGEPQLVIAHAGEIVAKPVSSLTDSIDSNTDEMQLEKERAEDLENEESKVDYLESIDKNMKILVGKKSPLLTKKEDEKADGGGMLEQIGMKKLMKVATPLLKKIGAKALAGLKAAAAPLAKVAAVAATAYLGYKAGEIVGNAIGEGMLNQPMLGAQRTSAESHKSNSEFLADRIKKDKKYDHRNSALGSLNISTDDERWRSAMEIENEDEFRFRLEELRKEKHRDVSGILGKDSTLGTIHAIHKDTSEGIRAGIDSIDPTGGYITKALDWVPGGGIKGLASLLTMGRVATGEIGARQGISESMDAGVERYISKTENAQSEEIKNAQTEINNINQQQTIKDMTNTLAHVNNEGTQKLIDSLDGVKNAIIDKENPDTVLDVHSRSLTKSSNPSQSLNI